MLKRIFALLAIFLISISQSNSNPKQLKEEIGVASYYGENHHGKKTASGEPFNMYAMTAAHRYLKIGTRIKVIDIKTNKFIVVKINDRGPYIQGRVLDLSKKAMIKLGGVKKGLIRVKIVKI